MTLAPTVPGLLRPPPRLRRVSPPGCTTWPASPPPERTCGARRSGSPTPAGGRSGSRSPTTTRPGCSPGCADSRPAWHDHGGSAGAFTVLSGVVQESTLPPTRSRGPAALVHRTLTAGRVRAFGPDYVRDVTNNGTDPAISLHVHAPALDTMRHYVLDDHGRPQVVALERSGADW